MKKKGSGVDLGTRVMACTCRHDFQDGKYGPGKRLHNFARKKVQGGPGWVCTVCHSAKPFGGDLTATKKEDKK